MRKLLFLLLLLVTLPVGAHYSIHSVSNGVLIESAGKQSLAEKGASVKPSDHLIIPKGGKVEIYNDLDKRIYASVSDGKISVTRLMIDARSAASDNQGNVSSRLSFRKSSGNSDQRLYVEKGMVKRSLGVYDPEGEKIVADPAVIARFIASRLLDSSDSLCDTMPASTTHEKTAEGGISFNVRNTFGFPVYFNIVKVNPKSGKRTVTISEVGQPTGIYVLLPDQTLGRGHYHPLAEDETHLMVMTHYQFDIDEMIEELEKAIKNPSPKSSVDNSLPVYLTRL